MSLPEPRAHRLVRPEQPMLDFVRDALDQRGLMAQYNERPHYQQNDYLMWISAAKQDATRQKRLAQMLDELEGGRLYMKMLWTGGGANPQR